MVEEQYKQLENMRNLNEIDNEVKKIDQELSRLNSEAAEQGDNMEPSTLVQMPLNTEEQKSEFIDVPDPYELARRKAERMKAFKAKMEMVKQGEMETFKKDLQES